MLGFEYAGEVRPAFIGIDVAIAKDKPMPIVISTVESGRLIPQRLRTANIAPPREAGNLAVKDPVWAEDYASETLRYITQVCDCLEIVPERIAIDASSSPCVPDVRRRAAEMALDQAGISCFATPTEAQFELIRDKVRRHLSSGGSVDRIPHANQLGC